MVSRRSPVFVSDNKGRGRSGIWPRWGARAGRVLIRLLKVTLTDARWIIQIRGADTKENLRREIT